MALICRNTVALASLLALGAASTAMDGAMPRVSADTLRGAAFDWLGTGDASRASEVRVFDLTCGKCVEEIGASLQDPSAGPSLFLLDTLGPLERKLTHLPVTAALALDEPSAQRQRFRELMELFVASSDHYRQNPVEWLQLVMDYANLEEEQLRTSGALALNRLDLHNRLQAQLGIVRTPGAIDLDSLLAWSPPERGQPGSIQLLASHALPWLLFGGSTAATPPEIIVNSPSEKLILLQWQELRDKAAAGAFWTWRDLPPPDRDEALVRWLAAFLDLPTDQARYQTFLAFLQKTTQLARQDLTSLQDAIEKIDFVGPPPSASSLEYAEAMLQDSRDFFRFGLQRAQER